MLTLLGLTIDTSGIADNEFKGLNDAPLGRAAFLAAVQAGTVVKLRGTLGGGNAVAWNQAELEDD